MTTLKLTFSEQQPQQAYKSQPKKPEPLTKEQIDEKIKEKQSEGIAKKKQSIFDYLFAR
jgi:hypothetical protein